MDTQHLFDQGRHTITRRSALSLAVSGGVAATAALAGCSAADQTPDQQGPDLEKVKQIELGPATEGVLYPDDYVGPTASTIKPFGDGKRTFKIVVPQDPEVVGDWNTNAFTKWFAERTGVEVEFQAVLTRGATGSPDLTKINAILASGDLPDAFLGIPFTDDQISLYGQQGALVAVEDYIQAYAPEMRRAMKDYADLRSVMTSADGKIYQFRGLNDCFHCRVSPGRAYVNQRYLERVGASIPETTEDLRKVLKLFKDKDPTGKGNIIPFAAGVNNAVDRYIMNAFLYNPGGDANGGWLALNGDTVAFQADRPEWREGLRYLRSLFDDGLLQREAFTMTDDELLRAGNQGRLGVARAYYWGTFIDVSYEKGAAWRDYVSLPPLQGPAGVRLAAWDYYSEYRGSNGLVITSACEAPDQLVRWADAQMELESTVRAYGGSLDQNWRWSSKGDKGIDDRQAIYALDTWPAPEKQSWSQYSVMYRSNDFRLGQFNDPDSPNVAGDMYKISLPYEKVRQPKELQVPPLLFDESSSAQRADLAGNIRNHVTSSMAEFATGQRDINSDADWSQYKQQLNDIGLADYLELNQAAYERRPR